MYGMNTLFRYFIVMNELDAECQTHNTYTQTLVGTRTRTQYIEQQYCVRTFFTLLQKLVFVCFNTHSTTFNIQQKRSHVPDLMIQNENRLQLFFTSTR